MTNKSTYEELEQKISILEKKAEQRRRFEDINLALFKISSAVNTTVKRDELFKSIHSALSSVVDVTNFFIALYDSSQDELSFPYIVDSVDEYYPSVIAASKTASLTAEVIRSGKPLLITKPEILYQQEQSPFKVPECTPSEIWLGVPLKTQDNIIGVMAVQSYENRLLYDQTDLNVMMSTADQVAITLDRKQKEAELNASEMRFRRIVTTANEGVISMDANWQITYVNDHFANMLDYEPAELFGKSFNEIVTEDDLDDFGLRKEERQKGVNSRFERRFKTKTGNEVCTIVSATALFGNDGQFTGSFGMVADITALKKTEATLQGKIAELNQAIDQIKTLRGIVPICMSCKKIRDDLGFWNQVEVYVKAHTEAEFSHGICPDCVEDLYPDLAPEILKKV